jgi:alanyl-tRNA synthetase
MALFGEKYESIVRVIEVGNFSRELCGGKHVKRTGDIGSFKIIAESSAAAGIRRIEAITGRSVIEYNRRNEKLIRKLTALFNTTQDNLLIKSEELINRVKSLEKAKQSEAVKDMGQELDNLISAAEIIEGVTVLHHQYRSKSMDELKKVADLFREKLKMGVGLFVSVNDEKPLLVATVTDAVIKQYQLNAGRIVKELGSILGGGGGGRPHLATAGGKNIEKIPDVIQAYQNMIKRELRK